MKTKEIMPNVESKLFRLIYLCGLKSQKDYDLEKRIKQKVRGKKKQRNAITQVSRAYKIMQANQDKCLNMSAEILPF